MVRKLQALPYKRQRKRGKGRCDLVKLHHGKNANGALFKGAEAMACPQFDKGIHRFNSDEK